MRFVIQHLDTPEDTFPSFDEIAGNHFLSPILGDINVLSNAPMTCGSKPEAHPDNSPTVSSYKVNIIPGGIIFNVHTHHYCNGLGGAVAFDKLLAENCYAVANKTAFPTFDPKYLDRSLYGPLGFDRPATSEQSRTIPTRRAHRHPQHKPSQSVLFHLRKSKALELKKVATPTDGTRISTYSAVCALMWRVLCKIREPLYKSSLSSKPLWAEGVSIHNLYDPPLPAGLQGNLQIDITSATSTIPQLTLAEVISTAPLSKLAVYTRQLTDSVTPEMLSTTLQSHAHVRNKQDLSINVDAFPPMSILVSDWRYANVCTFDFGFAKPSALRHLFGGVPLCQVAVYAPRKGPAGDDEGMEVQFTVETELVGQLLEDQEWGRYFEYRGVDAWEEEGAGEDRAKL